jgi:hypothetical protein
MTSRRQINVNHTAENLKQLLIQVLNKNNLFTQEELADWCCDYTEKIRDVDLGTQFEINAFSVAEDIDCQWELYLTNSYTVEQLQVLDKSKVDLPEDWFKNWLSKIVQTNFH